MLYILYILYVLYILSFYKLNYFTNLRCGELITNWLRVRLVAVAVGRGAPRKRMLLLRHTQRSRT